MCNIVCRRLILHGGGLYEHRIGFLSHTGPWMDTFGLGDAAKHIGTPQSIAIRNPDCSVATHLINLVRAVEMNCYMSEGE